MISLVDIAILVLILVTGYFSYARGFIRQSSAFIGLVLFLVLGDRLGLLINHALHGSLLRLLNAVLVSTAACAVGAWLGDSVGKKLRVRILATRLYMPDKYAGTIVGIIGSLFLSWFVCSLVFSANSANQQNTVLSSKIISFIDYSSLSGKSSFNLFYLLYPDHRLNIGQLVYGGGVPSSYNISVPTNFQGQFASALTKIYPSTVRILRSGCYLKTTYEEGSGYVAFPHIVVTAAHVVAGSGVVQVETTSDISYTGNVIDYDASRDIAIIYVPSLDAPALSLDPSVQQLGEQVAAVGFPGTNPFEVNDGVIESYGSYKQLSINAPTLDGGKSAMYYQSTAAAFPGDSGGPMITKSGTVVGNFTIYYNSNPDGNATDDNPADVPYTYSVALNDYYGELLKATHNIHRVSTGYCPVD